MPPDFPAGFPAGSSGPTFFPNETIPNETNDDSLQAARRLSVVYAQYGEPGFRQIAEGMRLKGRPSRDHADKPDHVPWDVMYRLILTADAKIVPKTARKAAAGAGGVAPGPGVTVWGPGCSRVGEPTQGNHAYAMLCNHLKGLYHSRVPPNQHGSIPAHLKDGMQYFLTMVNESTLAGIVRAALGAADANLALEEYLTGRSEDWKGYWADIKGAGRAEGDYVTEYIEDWLTAFPDCDGCHPPFYNPKGHDTPWQLQGTQS